MTHQRIEPIFGFGVGGLKLKRSRQADRKLDFSVGYTAMCLTNVLRVGKTIDPVLDVNQLPSAAPHFTLQLQHPRPGTLRDCFESGSRMEPISLN